MRLMIAVLLLLSGCAFHQAIMDMDANRSHMVPDGRGGGSTSTIRLRWIRDDGIPPRTGRKGREGR